jgi:hypothetical protein
LTVDLDHAGIAGLYRPELRVITDLRNFAAATVDYIYQPLARLRFLYLTVNRDTNHESRPFKRFSLIVTRCRELIAPVETTVAVVSMPLDQVTRPGAGAGANHGASSPPDQRASNRPYHASDDRSLGSAVVMTTVVASRAPLCVYIESPERAD